MDDRIIRAIDNNDTSVFYSCDVVMSSSIREYILTNKKRIINDILSLKLWLDDILIQKVYFDIDFVKASILVGNVDVASNFNNEEMHRFLTVNLNKIIELMLKKVYFLSSSTPSMLINNDNFVRICLDNGFVQILEYAPNFKKYYYENKHFIDCKCLELITKNIVRVDKFSSKLIKNNTEFLLCSIKNGNYDCLFFTDDIEINKYIIDNYRFIKNDFYKYVRNNNYFVSSNLNISLPAVKMLYSSCLKRNIFSDRIDSSLLLMASDNLQKFVSYMDLDCINYLFGKKIGRLYSIYGDKIFRIGYEKIKELVNCSTTAFDRFVKLFDPNVVIKMENVCNLYFLVNKEKFLHTSIFNKNTGTFICQSIKNDGVFSEEVIKIIDSIKNIVDMSYFDYLCDLIRSNNLKIATNNKNSKELINEIFEYYRRLTINFDHSKIVDLEKVICELCEVACANEFDIYMSSKMNFSDGYPFLVEPSDVFLKRVGREQRIFNIKKYIISDKNYFDYFCDKIYSNFKNIEYKNFKNDVKKYLETNKSLYGLNEYLNGVLSRLTKKDIVDISSIDYFNLPLTDEYLRTFINTNTLFEVLENLDLKRVLYFLNDDIIYNNLREILYDKQLLYLIDCFSKVESFYNKRSVINFINNFDLLVPDDILAMFNKVNDCICLPNVFEILLGKHSVSNKSDYLIGLGRRMLACLNKEVMCVPYISENIDGFDVCIGGNDIDDVVLGFELASEVMIGQKYDGLHNFILKNKNGFMIKFYKENLCALVYGIRYGNALFLCNLESNCDKTEIVECLSKFINKVVDKMKLDGDEIVRVYLSSADGNFDKAFSSCLKSVGVKIDYPENATILYSNGKKINEYALMEYKIVDAEYSNINERANKLNILKSINSSDMIGLIDYEPISAIKVGRNWYSDANDIVLE